MKRNTTLMLLFLLAAVLICIAFISSCKKITEKGHPLAYYNSPYCYDLKRIPLIFPYEIGEHSNCVELRTWYDYKSGVNWIDPNILFPPHRIIGFSWTNNFVYGELDTGWVWPSGEIQYFIFCLTETNDLRFTEKSLFERKSVELGLDITRMKPFEEQWEEYWKKYEKRAK